MSISILNTTTTGEKTQASSTQISIPATTAGSTLIIVVNYKKTSISTNFIDHCVDDGQFFPNYPLAVSRTTGGTIPAGVYIFYRGNVQAGISNVYVVPNDGSQAINYHATVYEVSGINAISPLDGSNSDAPTLTSPSYTGCAVSTSNTNALYIAGAMRANPATGGWGAGSGWTGDTTGNYTTSWAYTHIHRLAGPGSTSVVLTVPAGSSGGLVISAAFNPNPNAWTVDLSEDISSDDTIDNEAAFAKVLTETIILMDTIATSLTTLNHFKSLFDTITLGLTLALQMTYARTFIDVITLDDSLILTKDVFRTLSENLNLQDWLSVKKVNSSHWGN